MVRVNIADAKAQLSDLVARAEKGEEIEIARRGVPVARLLPPTQRKPGIDVEALRRLTDKMTYQEESAGEFFRRMRDSEQH